MIEATTTLTRAGVVRWNSRTPSRDSSDFTAWLMACGETSSRAAAAVKLFASATHRKATSPSS